MKYDFDKLIERKGTFSYKWRDEKTLAMWVADMDFCAAPEILAALKKRLDHGIFGYSFIPDEWSRAICGWWERRHKLKFSPDEVLFCTGVVPAISSAVRKFSSVGDKILVQAPVYNIFFNCIKNNARDVVINELRYQNGEYSIDFDDLEKKLSDPLVTLFLLCNPQNPVGKIWDEASLARIGDLCKKYGVLVLSDEIHCDLTDPDKNYVPFIRVNKTCAQNSITCVSPTKAFNLAGLQSSAIIVPNPKIRARMERAINTDEVAEPNAFACVAAIAAFNESEAWLDELRGYIYENKRIVAEFIKNERLDIHLVPSDATYLLWLDCSKICEDSTILQEFLKNRANLWLNDGKIYRANRGFLRLNIATQRSRVIDGLNRLKNGLELFKNS